MTRRLRVFSMRFNFSVSPSASFLTGIFVHSDTTSAIISGVTVIFTSDADIRLFLLRAYCFFSFSCSFLSSANPARSSPRRASSFSKSISSRRVSSASRSAGDLSPWMRTLAAASSIRSIALSGRKRSFRYLSDSLTHASTASSVMVTPWCFS